MLNTSPEKYTLPTISVATGTYDSADNLEKTLTSLLAQTYTNIEHIINDSFSTDGTQEIIADYIKRVNNKYKVVYIQTKPQGVAKALNDCLEVATGDILHYLHSDTYYTSPNVLMTVAKYFAHDAELTWLVGNRVYQIDGKVISTPETLIAQLNPKLYMQLVGAIHHENTFVKTSLVKAAGGMDTRRKLAVETRLWARLSKKYTPKFVNENFVVAICHPGSRSTHSIKSFLDGTFEAVQALKDERASDRVNAQNPKH